MYASRYVNVHWNFQHSSITCRVHNFISGKSESVHEESSAGDEGRTVPSSGTTLFLRFVLNLRRYPGPPYEDNIRLWPTDCDFDTWRHCQKGNKRRSWTCVFVSTSFAFPFVRRRRVFHVVPETHDFCRCLAPRYLCLPTSSNAFDRRSKRILDFLEFLLKRARNTKKKRRIDFLCQSRRYDIECFENVPWPNCERDSLITLIWIAFEGKQTLQNGGALPSLSSSEHIRNIVGSPRIFTVRAAILQRIILHLSKDTAERRRDDCREVHHRAGRLWCGARRAAATVVVLRQFARLPRRNNGEDVRESAAVEYAGSA